MFTPYVAFTKNSNMGKGSTGGKKNGGSDKSGKPNEAWPPLQKSDDEQPNTGNDLAVEMKKMAEVIGKMQEQLTAGLSEATEERKAAAQESADQRSDLKKLIVDTQSKFEEKHNKLKRKVDRLEKETAKKKFDHRSFAIAQEKINRSASLLEILEPYQMHLTHGETTKAEFEHALQTNDGGWFYNFLNQILHCQGEVLAVSVEDYVQVNKKIKDHEGEKKKKLVILTHSPIAASLFRQRFFLWQKEMKSLIEKGEVQKICGAEVPPNPRLRDQMPTKDSRHSKNKLEFAAYILKKEKIITGYTVRPFYDADSNVIRANITLRKDKQVWGNVGEDHARSYFCGPKGIQGLSDDEIQIMLKRVVSGELAGAKKRVRSSGQSGNTPDSKRVGNPAAAAFPTNRQLDFTKESADQGGAGEKVMDME